MTRFKSLYMFSTEVIFSKYFRSTLSWIHRGKTLQYGGLTEYVYIWTYKMNVYTLQRGFSLSIRNLFLLQESSSKVLTSHNYSWNIPWVTHREQNFNNSWEVWTTNFFSTVKLDLCFIDRVPDIVAASQILAPVRMMGTSTGMENPTMPGKAIQILHLMLRQMSCSKILCLCLHPSSLPQG